MFNNDGAVISSLTKTHEILLIYIIWPNNNISITFWYLNWMKLLLPHPKNCSIPILKHQCTRSSHSVIEGGRYTCWVPSEMHCLLSRVQYTLMLDRISSLLFRSLRTWCSSFVLESWLTQCGNAAGLRGCQWWTILTYIIPLFFLV